MYKMSIEINGGTYYFSYSLDGGSVEYTDLAEVQYFSTLQDFVRYLLDNQ